MDKCEGDKAVLNQLFGEIFKFYENQPQLRELVHPFLLYLMASAKLTPEEILELTWLEELILSDSWYEYSPQKEAWEYREPQNKENMRC